ncbi:MAG: sodium:calcium antiporter [Syntrophobacteraceae bacterium]
MKEHALPFAAATAITIPGLLKSLLPMELDAHLVAIVSGTAIFGAAFLLLWACEAAQKDISQTLALAVVALIAVLPEYAVDMYFTWQAGQHPESNYAQYAIANMTGANRLLIGLGWTIIAAIAWFRSRQAVTLAEDRKTEIFFLALATLYAFLIPVKGTLAWYDGIVFIGLYAWYIIIASRRSSEEPELAGPAELLGRMPKARRRMATLALFAFSATVILTNAEPFSESLVATGKWLGINEFLLVQWLAPIASEAPEFIIAVMFALRGHAAVAMGSLISSKLNQWTLLVGMIPWVYAFSSNSLSRPIPMGGLQMSEILLTAAQSLLAVTFLIGMKLRPRDALVLFALFAGQFIAPALTGHSHEQNQMLFTWSYIALSVLVLFLHRKEAGNLLQGVGIHINGQSKKPSNPIVADCPSAVGKLSSIMQKEMSCRS